MKRSGLLTDPTLPEPSEGPRRFRPGKHSCASIGAAAFLMPRSSRSLPGPIALAALIPGALYVMALIVAVRALRRDGSIWRPIPMRLGACSSRRSWGEG